MTRNEILLRKSDEYAAIVKDAFKRYKVPGKLDEEDFFQEMLLCVNSLLDEHPELDPFSTDFTNVFKTSFYRDIISLVRRYLTSKRDYHLEVDLYTERSDGTVMESPQLAYAKEADFYWLPVEDPTAKVQYWEVRDSIRTSLPGETLKLFDLLEDQKTLRMRLEEYNTEELDHRTTQCHNPRNSHFLAHCLGWSAKEVKKHFGVLRDKMSTIMGIVI